ncbi:armadillo repeat-containing protein 1-like isoform X1 [Diorhabda carinulata]|uniref:armadillo repeat-containing protein 1-like isoform X1 n=1 Tax=Diorhabda carinulata TaxID=1163345 RepID=UPI0025A04029|nr:armadillo repeat-containing protein 1-like isoform X1 [Diorhabda carinulata]
MAVIETLRVYKKQSVNISDKLDDFTDKKAILYAATLLESDDTEILDLCLDILENYINIKTAYKFILSTFGIYESIEALAIRTRDKNQDIYQRAIKLTSELRYFAPPAYSTRNRLKKGKSSKKHNLYILYVEGLNGENLLRLEELMVKIKGVISFLVDVNTKRCTIRISLELEINELVYKVYQKTGLKCFIVVRNKLTGLEEHIDILKVIRGESIYEYPEDNVSPSKGGNVIMETARNLAQSGNNVIKSIANFWNDALYW